MFRTKRFRTYTTDDVVGVEMAGALKNVYAIAVGMGYSLGIGENTRAMVIARAVREMSKLGEAVGGHRDTFAGWPAWVISSSRARASAAATATSANSSVRASRSTRSSRR